MQSKNHYYNNRCDAFQRQFNEVSFYENTFLHFSLCRFHSRNHQKREKVDIGSEKITMLSVSVLLLL